MHDDGRLRRCTRNPLKGLCHQRKVRAMLGAQHHGFFDLNVPRSGGGQGSDVRRPDIYQRGKGRGRSAFPLPVRVRPDGVRAKERGFDGPVRVRGRP